MIKKKDLKYYLGAGLLSIACCVPAQENPRFEGLKEAVFAEPYKVRPIYKVERGPFGKAGNKPNNHLRVAARRTLSSTDDLFEFENDRKLLQANGICFAGEWVIDQQSVFTGLFVQGVRSPVIVRASVALGGVLRKDKRAFGLAVKLLPSNLGDQPSLNLFVLNSMGGVVSEHVLDLAMDNQPPLGNIPRWRDIRTALRMRKDLEAADREQIASQGLANEIKPQVAFRPVTHIAAYRVAQIVSPKWIRFVAHTQTRVEQDDFRDELSLSRYPDQQIVYHLEVAKDNGGKKASASWQRIGRLILQESVTSKVCDARLHFQHPTLGIAD